MKQMKPPPYIRRVDILANAIVSDNPEIMRLNELPPEVQIQIITARMMGYQPVSVRWNTGEFALMACEPGATRPSTEKIVEAYYKCLKTNKAFPEGVLS